MFALGFRHKLILGLTTACSILLCVAALTYRTLNRNTIDRQWVSHTLLVLERLSVLEFQVVDAETGERGYVLTADEAYLKTYADSITSIPQSLHALRRLTSDNPVQGANLDVLELRIGSRLGTLKEIISIRNRQGFAAAQAAIANGPGKQHMDQIRFEVTRMKEEESRLLLIRTAELDVTTLRARLLIIFGEAVGFCFLLLAGAVIRQEMTKRGRSEEEIRLLNAGLERRIAERTRELVARSRDLERSNLELQQFAYVASHDLQEPLRTISSFTQLLAKRYREQLDDKAREFIDFAVDGCKRMQTLINDLLSFSRVGTEAKPLQPVRGELILDRALKSLCVAIQESGAQIHRDPLPVVMADEVQLTRLFQNLIANSIKFRGQQPLRIHISAQRQNAGWTISVRDNGIGISPEHRDRIFAIFQRLHTSKEYSGTGIGLAVCKKIAEHHGGAISVRPAPEGGSIFSFTINAGELNHAGSRKEKTHSGLRSNAATH
jgi:signal transduction histidine kinase